MKKVITILTISTIFIFVSYLAVLNMAEGKAEDNSQTDKKQLNFTEKVKTEIRKLKFEAQMNGILTTKNSTFLLIESDGKEYTIFLSKDTSFRPKYWGSIELADFNLGDEVNVIGNFRDKNRIEINATLVRDLSNERRFGVFLGDVVSKDKSKIIFNNKTRGELTAAVDIGTNFIDKNGKKVKLENIRIGDRIRVKGIFDNKTKKINDIDEIKDFSLQ